MKTKIKNEHVHQNQNIEKMKDESRAQPGLQDKVKKKTLVWKEVLRHAQGS